MRERKAKGDVRHQRGGQRLKEERDGAGEAGEEGADTAAQRKKTDEERADGEE